jgi:hypothetical protein
MPPAPHAHKPLKRSATRSPQRIAKPAKKTQREAFCFGAGSRSAAQRINVMLEAQHNAKRFVSAQAHVQPRSGLT